MSSVSSATNSSVGLTRSSRASSYSSSTCPGVGRHHVYRQPSGASLKRSQTHQMKMRPQEYKDPLAASCRPASSVASCSSGSTGSGRLPPIQEFQRVFRASRDRSGGAKDKPSASTRIRCAQKIVTQLENPAAAKKSYFRASPVKGLGKEQQSKAKKQEEKELKRKEKEEKENKRKEEKDQKRREKEEKDQKRRDKEENKRREREERKERDKQAKSKAKD